MTTTTRVLVLLAASTLALTACSDTEEPAASISPIVATSTPAEPTAAATPDPSETTVEASDDDYCLTAEQIGTQSTELTTALDAGTASLSTGDLTQINTAGEGIVTAVNDSLALYTSAAALVTDDADTAAAFEGMIGFQESYALALGELMVGATDFDAFATDVQELLGSEDAQSYVDSALGNTATISSYTQERCGLGSVE